MSRRLAAYEAGANMVAGTIMSNIVLFAFGLPLAENIAITAIMIVASFVRSYVIRRIFHGFHQ